MNRTTKAIWGVLFAAAVWVSPAWVSLANANEQPRESTRVTTPQEEYVQRVETQMNKWNDRLAKIEKLDDGQDSSRHATSQSRQEAIKEVRSNMAEIKSNLNEIRSNGEPSYHALKSKIDAKVDYVNSSLDQFAE